MRWWPIAVVILLLALIPFASGRSREKPELPPPAPHDEALPAQAAPQRLSTQAPSVSPFFFVEIGPESEDDSKSHPGRTSPVPDLEEQKDSNPDAASAESNQRAMRMTNWRAKWKALRAIRNALDYCYYEVRIQSPWLRGELKVEATVAPRLDANLGVIDELGLTFEKRSVPKFVYCVETQLRNAVIPKPTVRAPLTYDYTFAPREDDEEVEEEEDSEETAEPTAPENQESTDNS